MMLKMTVGGNMRVVPVVVLASVVMAGQAFAQDHHVENAPAPSWVTPSELLTVPASASGPVFTRRQDVLLHFDEHGQDQYVGYRLKLLNSSALEAGNIAISWNPAAGNPRVHSLKVYRGTEVFDVLKTAKFEILRREDQLEAARLDGILTASLRVPDLRVGDELELGFTTRNTDPTLGADDSGLLLLGPSPGPGRYRLGLSWDDGWKPMLQMSPDMAAVARNSERSIEFSFDNPPVSNPPKDAPLRYQWQRVVEYSDFTDWTAVSRRLAPLFAAAAKLAPQSPLKREASRIAAANKTQLGRAEAALKMVQQDVRYIYVGLDKGNLTPATADETWERRYGDCKGKTALLLALLGELGIEAQAVAINSGGSDDGLDQRLPSPRMFDHVLVRAEIDGRQYWLDGTLPSVVGASFDLPYTNQWALPLTTQGSALEHLEWHMASRPDEVNLTEIDARPGFDQPAKVLHTTITRGLDGLKQYVQFSGASQNQLLDTFRQVLTGGTWQSVDGVDWHWDQKAQASVLAIRGTWTLDWEDDGDGQRSMPLPGGGFSPPDRRGRAADQDQSLPYANKPEYSCHATTIRLPQTTRARQWASKAGFDTRMFGQNYYRTFELRDGAIRMIRGFRVERNEIDAATARKDNARIAGFDNSMGYIFYNPGGWSDPAATDTNVPATYDIDWTADDVPCLSASARASTGRNGAAK